MLRFWRAGARHGRERIATGRRDSRRQRASSRDGDVARQRVPRDQLEGV
jgi:hypothetical protein